MTLCIKCGKRSPVPGRKHCGHCLRINRKAVKKHYYKTHEAQLLRIKQKREKYKKEGRCPKCGCPAELMSGEYIQCPNCIQALHVPQSIPQFGGLLPLNERGVYENPNTKSTQ